MKNKELEILDYLLTCDQSVAIDQLCSTFHLNPRSIRYYMDSISQELKEAKITLDRGTYTIGNIEAIKIFMMNAENINSSTNMKKYILLFNFIFDGSVNLSKLSQELDISRVTAKQYLTEIETQLDQFSLKTKSDINGVTLIGSEESIRSIQLQTLLDYFQLSSIKQEALKLITQHYTDDVFDGIDQFLSHVQTETHSILTDYSYQVCKLYLIIAIRRIQDNKNLTPSQPMFFLKESIEFQAISKFTDILQSEYGVHFSESEQIKFTDLLIGSHYYQNADIKENSWFENNLFVTKLIANFSHHINMNLNQDHFLYNSLMTHLKPTMYRILHNIKLSELNTDDIITRFHKEYTITQKVLYDLKFFTNHAVDQDEIALITLHFKAAIHRYNSIHAKPKNILIVCSQGFGTSRLLEQQLNEVYSIRVLACIPSHFVSYYDTMDDVDCIITTIKDLEVRADIPIIHVKPILSSEDFKRLDESSLIQRRNQILLSDLMQTISQHALIQNRTALVTDLKHTFGNTLINDLESTNFSLLKFLPIENILIIEDELDWQTALSLCGDMLVNNGFVKENYVESMINAFENYGSYMVIDEGVAIPHARNEDNVIQTGIVLTICKHPVIFNDDQHISSFFAFCSADHQEHLDALVAISNLIRETNYKGIVSDFKDERDVITFIHQFASK